MTDQSTIEIYDSTALVTEPVVSVYMLAYRHERFLAEAIEGVVNQKCRFPFELVIGEDHSPDSTLAIAIDYQQRFPHLIRVLTSSTNVGAFANAARTRAACRGRYIAICEGDDYWHHPFKLQMQVDAMRSNEEITLCHTDYDRKIGIRIKRSIHQSKHTPHLARDLAYQDLLHDWTVITATAMYRADTLAAFSVSPFNNPRWPFGDYNKALFAAATGKVAYLPISTATWRKVNGSASNNSTINYLLMALAHENCREQFMRKYPVPDAVAESIRRNTAKIIMRRAFIANRIDIYNEYYDRISKHHAISRGARMQRVMLRSKSIMLLFGLGRRAVRWLGTLGSSL